MALFPSLGPELYEVKGASLAPASKDVFILSLSTMGVMCLDTQVPAWIPLVVVL